MNARMLGNAVRRWHGSLEASNLYVIRTELQELLARAFDAADERDSALVYYEHVANAWRGADTEFQGRRQAALARATVLRGGAGVVSLAPLH